MINVNYCLSLSTVVSFNYLLFLLKRKLGVANFYGDSQKYNTRSIVYQAS